MLADRIIRIFADGVITKGERHELYELMCDTVGDGGTDHSLATNYSTRLPFDEPVPVIRFEERPFVLTGTFCYGTRDRCELAIIEKGGKCLPRLVKQRLTLVVGRVATGAWIQSDFGRKIEKAVAYRAAGVGIQIVSEESWAIALNDPPLHFV